MEVAGAERRDESPELIISDSDRQKAQEILKRSAIRFRTRQLSEKQLLDAKDQTYIAGEFRIEILDPEASDKAANADTVHRAVELLKSNEIAVRYH